MKTVSMLEFRKSADAVLRQVTNGQSFILTYRGKPVARLEPVCKPSAGENDSIYSLDELASDKLEPVTNGDIDRVILAP
jgi:antitoxin (DNA-binding transcriptional repressor) of toxin-antitoxin stability system